ncbi:hypothetical protein TNIN_242211, partial [Trichonephila inaurata madagascariensis]
MVVFPNTFTLDALTCTLRLSTRSRMRGDIRRHNTQSLTEQRKGVSPVRERPSKLIAEVAAAKSRSCFGLCGDDQRLVLR